MTGKIYAKINHSNCTGWDLLVNDKSETYEVLMDTTNHEAFKSYFENSTFVPTKGMKVYVASDCPFAMADIRKSYQVKRKVEDADFILIPDFDKNTWWWDTSAAYLIPERKLIVMQPKYDWWGSKSLEEFTLDAVPDFEQLFDVGKVDSYKKDRLLKRIVYDDIQLLIDLYEGRSNKPFVYYKNLPDNNEIKLDIDILQMIYNVGKEPCCFNQNENFKLQLQAMNQTNWRSYLGTINMLSKILCNRRERNTASDVLGRQSMLPKAVKEMCYQMKYGENGFLTDDDAELARRFLENLLDFQVGYTSIEELMRKFDKEKIDFQFFYRLYDNIVKIRPKCIGR